MRSLKNLGIAGILIVIVGFFSSCAVYAPRPPRHRGPVVIHHRGPQMRPMPPRHHHKHYQHRGGPKHYNKHYNKGPRGRR